MRGLQQRTQTALSASRAQAARLEAEITQQLDAIAASLKEETVVESQTVAAADAFQAEIARLGGELENSRAAWLTERTGLEARLNEISQTATGLQAERDGLLQNAAALETRSDDLSQKLTSLEVQRDDLTKERAGIESQRNSLSEKVAGLEAERDDLTRKAAGLEVRTDDHSQKVASLEAQRDELSGKVARLESQCEDVSQKVIGLESQRDELLQKAAGFETLSDGHSQQLTNLEAERDNLSKRVTSLESQRDDLSQKVVDLESQRDGLSKKVAILEPQRDDLSQRVVELESLIQKSQDEWRNQLLDFESRLREQHSSWNEQRTEWTEARTGLERERDELQQKFDLALQDLQRLRARLAELEQDLARRPESNQADSAELVALRAERNALSAQVQELERRPTAQIDPNVEQQLADLQRRFELAVEDVREFKTKNAKLESQLAAAGNQPRTQPDTGGTDWESQKRRLLASLEEGAETNPTPVQKQQRITIEGTIEMTDAVVAEKDRQITELQAQLLAASDGAIGDAERNRKVNDLVDADEVIVEHRKRIRELQRETEDKLRAAELELSVERAKMARQRAELDELKSDLETKQHEFEATGGSPVSGKLQRRWRSKLGLTGDE